MFNVLRRFHFKKVPLQDFLPWYNLIVGLTLSPSTHLTVFSQYYNIIGLMIIISFKYQKEVQKIKILICNFSKCVGGQF